MLHYRQPCQACLGFLLFHVTSPNNAKGCHVTTSSRIGFQHIPAYEASFIRPMARVLASPPRTFANQHTLELETVYQCRMTRLNKQILQTLHIRHHSSYAQNSYCCFFSCHCDIEKIGLPSHYSLIFHPPMEILPELAFEWAFIQKYSPLTV